VDDLSGDNSSSSQSSGTTAGSVVKKGRKKSTSAIVIEDPVARGTDRRFCGRERDSRMVCCLPGARVQDVSERAESILKGEREQPEVVEHVGPNDIGMKSDEVLQQQFRSKVENKKAGPLWL